MKNKRATLHHHQSMIGLMSPANVLKKGFAIIKLGKKVINNAAAIQVGSEIEITLSDIELTASITQKNNYHGKRFDI